MNKYLINEPPLLVLPSLAKLVGLNEAILLQQIHYWLKRSKHEAAGERWVYNTYAEWLEQLPFWSDKTLRRVVKNLEDKGILISTFEFNYSINKTKWYRINYFRLSEITGSSSVTELIIDDYPLIFQPTLAVNYGLNEAIFLQQLHYWLKYGNPKEIDSHVWVISSYKSWLKQFQFWSEDTLYRTIKRLSEMNLIVSTDKYNKSQMDKTKWLTIVYENFPTCSDQTIPQVDQTIPQVDQTIPQVDQTIPQFDQTIPQVDQTIPQPDRIDTADCPERYRNLTSPHYYIDYITETNTEKDRKPPKQSLEISEQQVCVQSLPDILDKDTGREAKSPEATESSKIDFSASHIESPMLDTKNALIAKIRTAYDTAYDLFISLVDDKAFKRCNQHNEAHIKEGFEKYGDDFIDILFKAVKRSDFLLNQKTFKNSLTWLFKNADNVIAGKYDSESLSVYEKAQECKDKTSICSVIQENTLPLAFCRYCDKYINKKTELKKEKSYEEIADDCRNTGFCAVKKLRLKNYFPYCDKCSLKKIGCTESQDTLTELKQQAEKCWSKCSGMCAPRVMKTPALEYCVHCPGNPSGPKDKRIKKETQNTENQHETIRADFNDTDGLWKTAYKLFESNRTKIKKYIRDHIPYSVYSSEDLENDAVVIGFETLLNQI